MSVTYDVVSIGTLARNPFWGETEPVRPEHATTTLVRDGGTTILVDPSVPPEVLEVRLFERTGLRPAQVGAIFLTTWQPVHRRSLPLFEHADWLIWQRERDVLLEHIERMTRQQREKGQGPDRLIQDEKDLLERCKPAPDKLTAHIHLYPAPGVTPGTAGLLLAAPLSTVVVTGDAVISRQHFESGKVHEDCYDAEQATASMEEVLDVADQVIPGHDNLFIWPGRR